SPTRRPVRGWTPSSGACSPRWRSARAGRWRSSPAAPSPTPTGCSPGCRRPPPRTAPRRQGPVARAPLPARAAPRGLRPPAGAGRRPPAGGPLHRAARQTRGGARSRRARQGGGGARVPRRAPVPRAHAGVRGRRRERRVRLHGGEPAARAFRQGGPGALGGPLAPGGRRGGARLARERAGSGGGGGGGGGGGMTSLDLGLVGNGTIGALVDPHGEVVWACFPRFYCDPWFCSLLRAHAGDDDFGFFAVELA